MNTNELRARLREIVQYGYRTDYGEDRRLTTAWMRALGATGECVGRLDASENADARDMLAILDRLTLPIVWPDGFSDNWSVNLDLAAALLRDPAVRRAIAEDTNDARHGRISDLIEEVARGNPLRPDEITDARREYEALTAGPHSETRATIARLEAEIAALKARIG